MVLKLFSSNYEAPHSSIMSPTAAAYQLDFGKHCGKRADSNYEDNRHEQVTIQTSQDSNSWNKRIENAMSCATDPVGKDI